MAATSPPYGNERVSNMRLQTLLEELTREVRVGFEKVDRRVTFLDEKLELRLDEIERRHQANVKDVSTRCQTNTENIARVEERQKASTGILAGLTVLLSTAAGFIGSVFK